MKKIFILLAIGMSGCAGGGLIRTPAPQAALDTAKAVRISGEIAPYEIGFSGVYEYNAAQVRLAVISEVGIKLLDMSVTADKTYVHYHVPKLPKRVQAAFGRLAREAFFTSCPPAKITYYDKALRGTFEVRTQGGVCP